MTTGDATRFADRPSAVPHDSRMRILPVDGEGFVDFDVLTGLDTAATKNALVRIIPVKRIGGVNLVGLLREWDLLMIHREHFGGVMHRAVAVVVVADRAVKHMVFEQTVEAFPLRGVSPGGLGLHLHVRGNPGDMMDTNVRSTFLFPRLQVGHAKAKPGRNDGKSPVRLPAG